MKDLLKRFQAWSSEYLQCWLPTFPAMLQFSLRDFGRLAIATHVVAGLDTLALDRENDILKYVDPLIGTTEGGETCYRMPRD